MKAQNKFKVIRNDEILDTLTISDIIGRDSKETITRIPPQFKEDKPGDEIKKYEVRIWNRFIKFMSVGRVR